MKRAGFQTCIDADYTCIEGQLKMTVATFAIASLIGATLGFRFKVLILLPAIGFAVLGIAGIAIGRGDHANEVMLAMIWSAVALQIGYFLGLVARTIIVLSVMPAATRILVPDR